MSVQMAFGVIERVLDFLDAGEKDGRGEGSAICSGTSFARETWPEIVPPQETSVPPAYDQTRHAEEHMLATVARDAPASCNRPWAERTGQCTWAQ
eukprot:5818939-Pyramimonas_sp.AAC.1